MSWTRNHTGLLLVIAICLALPSVHGIVTVAPRAVAPYGVYFHNQYGNLTATSRMPFNSFTMYANGTMFFDISTLQTIQSTWSFLVQAYGNGTLQLRFRSTVIPNTVVDVKSSSSTFSLSANWLQVQYTSSFTGDPLIITYAGKSQISSLFASTILGLGVFIDLIPFLTIIKWIKQKDVGDSRPFSRMLLALFVLGTAMAIVGALLVAIPNF